MIFFIDKSQEDIVPTLSVHHTSFVEMATESGPSQIEATVQPRLTEDDLTDDQKAIVVNLMDSCGFTTKLILLAFQKCPTPHLEEAIQKWCIDNQNCFDSDTQSNHDDILDPCSEPSDNEFEDNVPQGELSFFQPSAEIFSNYQESKVYQKPMPRITVREQMPINEHHPHVMELLLAGYLLEQCIDAVKKYPDNNKKAMDYLNPLWEDSKKYDQNSVVKISNKSYLSLVELGIVLQKLSQRCKGKQDVTQRY